MMLHVAERRTDTRVPHTWLGNGDVDGCIDCGTTRWRRYVNSPFEHLLYRVPGETTWRDRAPDCAAVAADKMRTDGGAA